MAILEIEKTQDGQENHLDIVPTLDRLFLYLLGDLSACLDHDRFGSSSGLGSDFFNLIDDIESINNTSENSVLSIQPWGIDGADEELRSVCVGAGVGHRKDTLSNVRQVEVLIFE
mmetsp:Transcript_2090/g.4389  ORF Transcript_2090/g.4389 Transcript_2090/m.4389 type:complete len:115 (+) Transcript_2090:52-396(+)